MSDEKTDEKRSRKATGSTKGMDRWESRDPFKNNVDLKI